MKRPWLCKYFAWHKPMPGWTPGDDMLITGCERCDAVVSKDAFGMWFEVPKKNLPPGLLALTGKAILCVETEEGRVIEFAWNDVPKTRQVIAALVQDETGLIIHDMPKERAALLRHALAQ